MTLQAVPVSSWLEHSAVDARSRLARLLVAAIIVIPLLVQVYSLQRYGRSIRMTDEFLYHVHARSWYFDGDCRYSNDIAMAPGFANAPYFKAWRTANGETFNHIPCGTAIVSFPLIALADGLTLLHNQVSAHPLPRDGYSWYYQAVVGLGHTLLGVAGLLAVYALAARYSSRPVAAAATLATLLGTNTLYYVGFESTHSHADCIAWVAFLLLVTDNARRDGLNVRLALQLGLVAGMLVATRPSDSLWVLAPVVALGPAWIKGLLSRARFVRHFGLALLVVGAVCATLVPQVLVNLRLHDAPWHNPYRDVVLENGPAIPHWAEPDFARVLTCPTTGLLWTAPLALVAITGIATLPLRRAATLTGAAVGFVAMYYVVACASWLPGGFGHRFLASCTAAFALGLCAVLTWAAQQRRRSISTACVLAAGVALELALFIGVDRGWWAADDPSLLSRCLLWV